MGIGRFHTLKSFFSTTISQPDSCCPVAVPEDTLSRFAASSACSSNPHLHKDANIKLRLLTGYIQIIMKCLTVHTNVRTNLTALFTQILNQDRNVNAALLRVPTE